MRKKRKILHKNILCSYCCYPLKENKSIKCNNCEKKFCLSCLTKVTDTKLFCHSCCINTLRENTAYLFLNDENISKKVKIKKPILKGLKK